MGATNNSIIARMGLDLTGLQRDFSAAEKIAVRSANQMQGELNKAAKGGGGHGGGMAGARGIGDALDAITGERGWVMRMSMIQHSLPLAAVSGLAIGLAKAKEAYDELAKSSDAARETLAKPMGVVLGQGGQAVSSYVEELRQRQDDLREKQGVFATIGNAIHQGATKLGNAYLGTLGQQHAWDDSNAVVRSHQQMEELEKRRVEMAVEYKQLSEDQIAERKDAAAIGGKELELVTARQRMEREIADIQAKAPTETKSTLIEERRAAFELEKAEIDRKAAASQRQRDLEYALLTVKMKGRDVAIEEAKARLESAQAELEAAQGRPEELDAAQIKAQAAQLALRDAQRQTEEHRAQLAIAVAIANYRAPEEEKQLQKLKDETGELRRQLSVLGEQEEKRAEIQAKIDENNAKERALDRAKEARAHGLANTVIDATTGEGEAEQARAIARRLAEARRYQSQIANNPEVAPQEKADIAAKIKQLELAQSQLNRSREKAVRDAKTEVDVLSEELQRHGEIASYLKMHQEFADKIAEAHRNGNTALEEQLKKQEQITLQLQIQKLQSQVGDTQKATLHELATHAFNENGRKAREAERLEQRYDKARMAGHGQDPYWQNIQKRAETLRSQIGPLKDSEKQGGIAKEQLSELKKIEKNTHDSGVVGP